MTSVFEVLSSTDTVSESRAVIAVQSRAKTQFGAFLANKTGTEFDARFQLVLSDVANVATEVADEYGVDVLPLVEAATEVLAGGHDSGCDCAFCKNKGNLPGSKKDDDKDDSDEKDSDSKDKDDDDSDKDDSKDKKPWESSVHFPTSKVEVNNGISFDWEEVTSNVEKTATGVCTECHHPMDKHSAEGNSVEGEKGCTLCDCTRAVVKDEAAGGGLKSASVQTLAMAVSRRDFEAIAGILQQNGADPGLAQQIADYFQTQNPNFDNQRFMDASQPQQQAQPGQAQTFAMVTAAIKLAAEPSETGDSYWSEKLDLGSFTSDDGISDVGSPKIDKGNSGTNEGWTLPKIDVPSERHPTEEQNILQPREWDKELPGPSDTGKRIDADSPLQPEFTTAPNTDTWSGTEGQASPVTSKFQVVTAA